VASDPDASEIGPDTGAFTVTRTDGTNNDLTVFYHVGGTARPRVDYQALPGHLTIPAGASSADITVTPIADVDTTLETNEPWRFDSCRPFCRWTIRAADLLAAAVCRGLSEQCDREDC